ncbi:hypothetical protein F5I97DRAFT_1853909 [Phlebopus sp. FC_14]|nr:hypothetical protein F5I97DRAFT_1853909 [Phlebopus sp. FC_14]
MFDMLSNFKKKYLDPYIFAPPATQEETGSIVRHSDVSDPESPQEQDTADAERHWTNALFETIRIAGCACIFCRRRSHLTPGLENGRARHAKPGRNHHRSMPHTNSIMQVLYPPSYLNTPLADPDPPAYFPGEPSPPMPDELQERGPPIFSRNAPRAGPYPASYPVDVPRTGIPVVGPPLPNSRRERASPCVPPLPGQRRVASRLVGSCVEIPEETEELPPYSRFDTSRPRFPAAPDILGPYPHISILNPGAH